MVRIEKRTAPAPVFAQVTGTQPSAGNRGSLVHLSIVAE
jgi:hypothetical protein